VASQTLTIRRPDDWHVHLRDGEMLERVAPFTARQFARAIAMPNLVPPITTVEAAIVYRERIVGDRIDYAEPFAFEGLREAVMEAAGPLESLVERAGEWFERLLTWPIERRGWFAGNGQLVYHEWVLSDIEEKLVVNASWPPQRRPDRVVLVRGDRDRRARAGKARRRTPSWPWRRRGGA